MAGYYSTTKPTTLTLEYCTYACFDVLWRQANITELATAAGTAEMSTAFVIQVTSLQAQATEHRMIKEKLQAAVAAALGDAAVEAYPIQLPSNASQQHNPGSNPAGIGSADDLQDAISSLKVFSTSYVNLFSVTACHGCMLMEEPSAPGCAVSEVQHKDS